MLQWVIKKGSEFRSTIKTFTFFRGYPQSADFVESPKIDLWSLLFESKFWIIVVWNILPFCSEHLSVQFSTTKATLLGPLLLQILALVMEPGRQQWLYRLLQRHIFPHILFWIAFFHSLSALATCKLLNGTSSLESGSGWEIRTTASIGVGVMGLLKWFSMSKQLVESKSHF